MPDNDARKIFEAAVKAVHPSQFMNNLIELTENLLSIGDHKFSLDEIRKIIVIGMGKASAAMAFELEKLLGERIDEGVIVTKTGHSIPLQYIKCLEAAHPVPDEQGVKAATSIIDCLNQLEQNDLLICLISGGATALLADVPEDVKLKDLQTLFRLLLDSGATISEMNTVRKHVSTLKGGQLLRHSNGAQVVSLILSDVIGDPVDIIGSGCTVADPSTYRDAWEIIKKYHLETNIPGSIANRIKRGIEGKIPDTPKPGDPEFERCINIIAANNKLALDTAAAEAKNLAYSPFIVSTSMHGEAREVAEQICKAVMDYKGPRPACLLWGGETTVTVKGNGKGGRNQELALAALNWLNKNIGDTNSCPDILSAGTDGSDGMTDATGAIVSRELLEQLKKQPVDIESYLSNNDSYSFFSRFGGLLITGPSHTNVMDVVVALVH